MPHSTDAHQEAEQSNEARANLFKRAADKIDAIGDAWDNIDNTAEMYGQRFGDAVSDKAIAISDQSRAAYDGVVTTVNDKAIEISNQSRSAYDVVVTTVSGKAVAIDSAAQKNWKQLEVIAKDYGCYQSNGCCHKHTKVTEIVNNKSTMVTNKAKSIS